MKHITDNNHDNDELTAKQFLQQHDLFIENVSQKLLKCIEYVYNNADKLSKTRKCIILQQKKMFFLTPWLFGIFPCTIILYLENLRLACNK